MMWYEEKELSSGIMVAQRPSLAHGSQTLPEAQSESLDLQANYDRFRSDWEKLTIQVKEALKGQASEAAQIIHLAVPESLPHSLVKLKSVTPTGLSSDISPGLYPEQQAPVELLSNLTNVYLAVKMYSSPGSDEDAPPVAQRLKSSLQGSLMRLLPEVVRQVTILSAADGLGGSGSQVVSPLDQPDTKLRQAYIASRTAHEALDKLMKHKPDVFFSVLPNIQQAIELALGQEFTQLPTRYHKEGSGTLKSKLLTEYPTTLATTVIQETSKTKIVNLFWQGDSPIFILTPDTVYTTAQEGDGDKPLRTKSMTHVIDLENYKLQSHRLEVSADTPMIVVVGSDALLKLAPGNAISSVVEFVMQCLRQAQLSESTTDANKLQKVFTQEYLRALDGGAEPDDATLAISVSLPQGKQFPVLDSMVKVQHLSSTSENG